MTRTSYAPGGQLERRPPVGPERVSQSTAVEMHRAAAEVEAAVIVAQRVPRDMARAEAEMREECSRFRLADRAFYAVQNRGSGPSVHLARALARVFGNIQYGVKELSRDDARGESEIEAFAWDVQTNVRSTRSFIVPHQKMVKPKGGGGPAARSPLTDLHDIYLNNQNIGARAVRECIFTALPVWFTDLAEDLCRETLKNGDGKPLSAQVDDMVAAFGGIGVRLPQMETRLKRKRGSWTPQDVAEMRVVFRSIQRGETTVDEQFAESVALTKDDVLPPAGPNVPPATSAAADGGEWPATAVPGSGARA